MVHLYNVHTAQKLQPPHKLTERVFPHYPRCVKFGATFSPRLPSPSSSTVTAPTAEHEQDSSMTATEDVPDSSIAATEGVQDSSMTATEDVQDFSAAATAATAPTAHAPSLLIAAGHQIHRWTW